MAVSNWVVTKSSAQQPPPAQVSISWWINNTAGLTTSAALQNDNVTSDLDAVASDASAGHDQVASAVPDPGRPPSYTSNQVEKSGTALTVRMLARCVQYHKLQYFPFMLFTAQPSRR